MTVAHVDPVSGASGDMLLGAVVDAGVDPAAIAGVVATLRLEGWELEVHQVLRGGIGATQARVVIEPDGVVRTWANVHELLATAPLPAPVRERALGAFRRLAEAESRIHRQPVERVHFHEVGALDAIVDVVGTCAGLHLLGVTSLSCAPLPQGVGMTRAGHGLLPVPAPAVLELLKGAPTYATGVPAELVTPTGAALLAEWTDAWGPMPELVIDRIGYGAGSRELEAPNVLRLVIGTPTDRHGAARALVLATTVDDLAGELVPPVLDALRLAGASDAWARPVHMKKGRPGVEIVAVGDPALGPALREVLFRETTTLGVRGTVVDKWVLDRAWVRVDVAGEPVRLKIGRLAGAVVNVAPEFDDCAAAAAATGLPLKEVFARARSAWRDDDAGGGSDGASA